MNRTVLIAGVAVATLTLAACNKNASTNPPSAATPAERAQTPDAHPAATIPTPANEATAPDFVTKAASSDMFEVAAAKIAETKATNPEVKKFARMMVDAHTKSTAALRGAIKDSGQPLALPTTLPADLQDKIEDLNKASPGDFDKTYMDQQVDGHQAALNLMQRYAQDGDVAQIKAFAAATAPVVQQHLTKAQGIKDGLGNAASLATTSKP